MSRTEQEFNPSDLVTVLDLNSPFLAWQGEVISATHSASVGWIYQIQFVHMNASLSFREGQLKSLSPRSQDGISLRWKLEERRRHA